MKYSVIAFRDVKANLYLPPLCVPNVNAAIREIAEEVNKPEPHSSWAKWPDDHELYELGTWDSDNGKFQLEGDHKQLLLLSTLKR